MFISCSVATEKRKIIIYGSLNYLVNMTMDSNLITATKRTLLVLQITNQTLAMGRNIFYSSISMIFLNKKSDAF